MDENIVLSPATAALAEKARPRLLSPEYGGQRKVSLGLLSPSTTSCSSSSSSQQPSPSPRDPATEMVIIPTRLDSIFAYQFLGFTEETARQLRNAIGIDDIHDDWNDAMKRAGIKDDVRRPMLKPEHSAILYTQPLSTWLLEIIDTFYEALDDLEDNVLLSLGEPTAQLRGGADDEEEEEYTVPQTPGGHLAVFKSVDGRRTNRYIKEDGALNLEPLESIGPTDFARCGGLYFTHQIWVAKAYSRLINDACNVADRRTMELHVPLSHFEEIKTWELKFGNEWKRLVWYCRRQQLLPEEVRKQKSQHGCIQGPIAHSHNATIVKLRSWEYMAWKHVVTKELDEDGKTETRVAVQRAWIEDEAIAALEEAVVGKAYVRLPEA
ncbi:hypothetical protein OPT61_g9104 [Boeremia exigua]|uniref:Uncharacterized protein n=1 Tax=Boeremia exigua TaxID=749465 RepID=A0ACC2HWB4_9PLEO|nr:hypothetical protein OPT61_g9104 [Boeremia exigua]